MSPGACQVCLFVQFCFIDVEEMRTKIQTSSLRTDLPGPIHASSGMSWLTFHHLRSLLVLACGGRLVDLTLCITALPPGSSPITPFPSPSPPFFSFFFQRFTLPFFNRLVVASLAIYSFSLF